MFLINKICLARGWHVRMRDIRINLIFFVVVDVDIVVDVDVCKCINGAFVTIKKSGLQQHHQQPKHQQQQLLQQQQQQ